MNNLLWIIPLYVVLSILLIFVAGIILRFLLRKLKDAWSHSGALFGDDTKTRLIGLGVSALFFPNVITSITNFIVGFAYEFFVTAPSSLVSGWVDRSRSCSQDCLASMSTDFVRVWTSAISDSLLRLAPSRFPYTQLIFLLATWAIITLVFDLPNTLGNQKTATQSKGLKLDATKQNFLFFAILAFAGYLSIVAIITIPSLQEVPNISEEVKVERLSQQMNDMYTQWNGRTSAESEQTNPFAEIDEYIVENSETTRSTKRWINEYKNELNRVRDQHKTLMEDAKVQLEDSMEGAVLEYETTSVSRKGSLETIEHFSSLIAWYRRLINEQDAQIKYCKLRIEYIESTMSAWGKAALDQLKSEGTESNIDRIPVGNIDIQSACTIIDPSQTELIPERPELGSNLGPFSNVASWLLKTESLPLAQIVGMMGFGLLGSAIASLVRQNNVKLGQGKPIVEDLGIFVIRGATAAVVVFLSVKGGLAIFTSGSGEPNPYVLLFTCLVGAVFSEDVWQRAGEWLKKPKKDDDAPPPPAPPKPQEPIEKGKNIPAKKPANGRKPVKVKPV